MGVLEAVVGLDLGTSALKCVWLDRSGHLLAEAQVPYALHTGPDGRAEQDPADWLRALAEASARCYAQVEGGGHAVRIVAVGLTGQMPTLVVVDAQGTPVRPAITWADNRADRWAGQRMTPAWREEAYRRTGMPLDGRYLAPMAAFHLGGCPDRAGLRLFSAKDYLFFALTGGAYTDPSTAAGYGVYHLARRAWDPELAAFWGIALSCLPALAEASWRMPLTAAGARLLRCSPGVPVTQGAADSVAGVLALGGLQDGVVSVVSGSSTVIMDSQPALHLDPAMRYLVTPHAKPGWFGREMDLLATGSAYAWLLRVAGVRDPEEEERLRVEAKALPPGAEGISFAPYLAGGEQGALWNPTLTGTITGLGLQHGSAHLLRALWEGIAFETRRCVEVLAETAAIRRLLVTGAWGNDPWLRQLLADVCRVPVVGRPLPSAAALGAALLTGEVEPPEGDPVWQGPAETAGDQAGHYEELYGRYRERFPG